MLITLNKASFEDVFAAQAFIFNNINGFADLASSRQAALWLFDFGSITLEVAD